MLWDSISYFQLTKVRDEGYSPSPYTRIDEDEGYSPSPYSVSIPCDQNSLFTFNPSSDPRVSALVSAFFVGRLCPHHAFFLAFLSKIACGLNPQSMVRYGSLQIGVCPIPSLNLEEAFPPTSLTEIHFGSEGCSDLEKLKLA
jgi:hypothetical protein